MKNSTRFARSFVGALALATTGLSHAESEPGLGDLRKVGDVSLKTSCTAPAQKTFARGLALLHSFFYEEAKRVFEEALDTDPQCAMAEWGVAMTYYHPIWAPPDEAALKAGAEAVQKAKQIGGKTPLEQGFIAAASAFYSTDTPPPATGQAPVGVQACHGEGKKVPDHSARAKAYGEVMAQLAAKNPTDVDTQALYALSLLGSAPPGDPTLTNQKKAGALIETLLPKNPTHPGLLHYYIHAYDSPPLAKLALAAAQKYAAIAPWVPHVLHMPSHIFTRLGLWKESVESNLASASAARAYAKSHHPDAASFEELHALDYLIFAYLQTAHDKEAEAVLARVRSIQRTMPQEDLAVAHTEGAAPARWFLERARWKDAAQLEVPAATYWKRFPYAEAHLHYARGIGAALSGQIEVARKEVARLAEIAAALRGDPKLKAWTALVEIEAGAVEAFAAHASGRDAEAEKRLREIADREDVVGVQPVSPGPVLPTRELLADLLLELKRPGDALKEYAASLAIRPARYYATAGAEKAAKAAGDAKAAHDYHTALLALTQGATNASDGRRPELTAGLTAGLTAPPKKK